LRDWRPEELAEVIREGLAVPGVLPVGQGAIYNDSSLAFELEKLNKQVVV